MVFINCFTQNDGALDGGGGSRNPLSHVSVARKTALSHVYGHK